MIRYVMAVALTVAIVGLVLPAIEQGSAMRGEQSVETTIARLEAAAQSLRATEAEPTVGEPGPRRSVDVTLPGSGFASTAQDHLVFELRPGGTSTQVTYRVGTRGRHRTVVDAPLVGPGGGNLDLSGETGHVKLILQVQHSRGRPVVEVRRA